MKIITTNPIIDEKDYIESEWFSNASSATRKRRRASRQKKRGEWWDKLKRGTQNILDSGILQTAANTANINTGDYLTPGPPMDMAPTDLPPPSSDATKKGMSKTTKIVLFTVLAVGVSVGGYFLYKKLKK